MSDPIHAVGPAPTDHELRWTFWLIVFLRVMAVISMVKGIYHWSEVLGVGDGGGSTFETKGAAWQAATIYFAVIDLVAAVGLWLAAAWGGVLWLTAAMSIIAIELFFPQVYGGRQWVIASEATAILLYFALTIAAARERPGRN
jgi:hypothetical protein